MDMSTLPLEIEAEIFELTARAYPKEIPSLMLVAYRVYHWLEPILYANVIIGTNYASASNESSTAGVLSRPQRPRGVKRICVTYHAPVDPSIAFLKSSTGLTALACWCPSTAAISTIPSFRYLHTLSISADNFLLLPALESLTHLELIVLETLETLDVSPHVNLKNIGFLDFPSKATYDFVPQLLESDLELIYVLFYYWDDSVATFPSQDDPRVVLMSRLEVKYNALESWKADTLWPFAKSKRDEQKAKAKAAVQATAS